MSPTPVKMIGKLRYLRKVTLYFFWMVHWISGATAPATKKKTRP
jgi:hypothetical protein